MIDDKLTLLNSLHFGGTIAEQDDLLGACFIEHPVVTELLLDRKDIVLGAKGAGKSALWKELTERQNKYEQLATTNVRPITNPTGDQEFRDVLLAIQSAQFPDVEQLRLAWRLYLIGQMWLAIRPNVPIAARERLGDLINKYGLIESEASGLRRAFAFAIAKAKALQKAEVSWKEGLKFEFSSDLLTNSASAAEVPFNDLLKGLDDACTNANRKCWLILDRLDEVVLEDERRENAVLKGLLYAFRDVSGLRSIKVKIFLRDDVYDRVTSEGGFAALTHVQARATPPIRWSVDDLQNLIVKRILANESLAKSLGLEPNQVVDAELRKLVYYALFPDKIDKGRAAEGFKWIIDRITDGNGVATPRDLISVLDKSRLNQIDMFQRDLAVLPGDQLFSEEAIRSAVKHVAKDNLVTRVYAEYPALKEHLVKFTRGKADHNEESLKEILGSDWSSIVEKFVKIGFMYRRMRNDIEMWTIPFFYTNALDATRGAAFDLSGRG